MYKFRWHNILLCILLLALVVTLSGCRAVNNLDRVTKAISAIPSRLGEVVIDLMGGIGNIGNALANQVGNIVKGMTGR